MSAEVVVRAAASGDAAAVADVYARSWRAAFGGLLPEELVPTHQLRSSGAAMVSAPVCLVAVLSAHPVGGRTGPLAGVACGDPATGNLDRLYVDPAAWGSGAGASLLTHMTAELRAGGRRPWLWVWSGNTRATGFYARHGWVTTGEERVSSVAGVRFHYRRLAAPADRELVAAEPIGHTYRS